MSKGKDKGKSFIDIGLLYKQIESYLYIYDDLLYNYVKQEQQE